MELSFYVHIPYCIKRCGYCDFNTYTPNELQDGATLEIVSNDYIDAVLKELDAAPMDEVPTIFFGGGTPSLLPADDLGRVIAAIKSRNGLAPDCEITLEANPDSVTAEKLARYIEVGFNRISFGMQSAKPHVLAVLDRTHNPDNVKKAVDMARAAGFGSISVDLIYGTPGESLDDWRETVTAALALDIDHIIEVDEEEMLVSLYSYVPIPVPDNLINAVGIALLNINPETRYGSIEICSTLNENDENEHFLRYRAATYLRGIKSGKVEAIENMVTNGSAFFGLALDAMCVDKSIKKWLLS